MVYALNNLISGRCPKGGRCKNKWGMKNPVVGLSHLLRRSSKAIETHWVIRGVDIRGICARALHCGRILDERRVTPEKTARIGIVRPEARIIQLSSRDRTVEVLAHKSHRVVRRIAVLPGRCSSA